VVKGSNLEVFEGREAMEGDGMPNPQAKRWRVGCEREPIYVLCGCVDIAVFESRLSMQRCVAGQNSASVQE
jgi:hypothetical protein